MQWTADTSRRFAIRPAEFEICALWLNLAKGVRTYDEYVATNRELIDELDAGLAWLAGDRESFASGCPRWPAAAMRNARRNRPNQPFRLVPGPICIVALMNIKHSPGTVGVWFCLILNRCCPPEPMTVLDFATLEASVAEHATHIINDLAGHVIRRRSGDLLTEQNLSDGWLRWVATHHNDLVPMDDESVLRLYTIYRNAFFAADVKAEESTRRIGSE